MGEEQEGDANTIAGAYKRRKGEREKTGMMGEKSLGRWGRRKSPFGNSLFPTSIDFFPRELRPTVATHLLLGMSSAPELECEYSSARNDG